MDGAVGRAILGRYWDALWQCLDPSVVDELIGEPYERRSSAGTRALARAEFKRELKQASQLLHEPRHDHRRPGAGEDKVWTRATT